MDATNTECCYFGCDKDGPLIIGRKSRIETVIQSSKQRNDNLHIKLQDSIDKDPNCSIKFHKTCVSSYTSKSHIQRVQKRTNIQRASSEPPPKRRASLPTFNFRICCVICGDECIKKDPKNPKRWRRTVQCKTLELKDKLQKVCLTRKDELASQVQLRIQGAVSDLHAADAQYHHNCYVSFTSTRNVTTATKSSSSLEMSKDHTSQALDYVISEMMNDTTKIWSSIEVYKIYSASLSKLTGEIDEGISDPIVEEQINRPKRALLIRMLELNFDKKILVMRVDGCASLLCLREHIPKNLELVKANDSCDSVSNVIKSITEEVRGKDKPETYDIGSFTFDKAVKDTSSTLLQLISGLVSSGTVTKQLISIAQSIQALTNKTFNETTLGLAVKLHHQFGSRELIDILHSSGYICSYDEVLRFRKSAAKVTAEDSNIYKNVMTPEGLISTWFDNFDLQVFTPNGNRESHCMAVEFIQNSIGNYAELSFI